MYTFISSIAKSLSGDEKWENTDISNVPLDTLFRIYSRVIVILSNPFLPNNVAVELGSILSSIGGLSITLNEFLIQNGNKTLPAMSYIPTLSPKYAHYADAVKAGYKITPCNPKTSVSSNQPESDKQWLYLTKPNIDYDLFYKSCLVSVDGFIHLTDTDGTGIYVVDGMKTARKGNLNHIGFCSFASIGSMQLIPIESTMLYKQNTRQAFNNEVYVNLGVDTTNKTVMVVIGGYLHVLDKNTFFKINESTFKIDTANLPLLDRYYESKDYLDFSTLPLSSTPRNEDQVSIDEFFSDANITAYLTLSQSFFVVLDNKDIMVETLPIKQTPSTDMFVCYEKPTYPIFASLGRMLNYWSVFEDGQWSITTSDAKHRNYLYHTFDPMVNNSVDDSLLTTKPVRQTKARFMKLSSMMI